MRALSLRGLHRAPFSERIERTRTFADVLVTRRVVPKSPNCPQAGVPCLWRKSSTEHCCGIAAVPIGIGSAVSIYRVPVNIAYVGAGQPGVNVWHVRTTLSAGTDPSQLQAMVTAIRTFYDGCKTVFPTSTNFTLGTVTEVSDQTEAAPTWTTVTGTAVNAYAPQALAIVVSWRTTIAARRARGRTFLGPVGSAIMDTNGTPVDSYLTAIRAAAATMIATSTAFGNGAVAVYGQENPMPDPPVPPASLPHVARDITAATVRDIFGVLRSRRD